MKSDHEGVDDRTARELASLADGSLAPGRARRLLARAEREPILAAKLAAQRRAIELVHASGGESASAELQRVVVQLNDQADTRERDRADSRERRPRRPAVFGGAVAVACAVAIALAVVLTTAGGVAPTLRRTVALTQSPALLPSPRESRFQDGRLDVSVGGVAFPYWGKHSGWAPSGARVDRVGGRLVKTVFYRSRGGDRVGYAIVAGSALSVAGASRVWRDGVEFRRLRMSGANVITWVERGHSCVMSGNVSGGMLLHLATL